MTDKNAALVYSTGRGRICPRCGENIDACNCRGKSVSGHPASGGIIRIRRDKKGRKGKIVTLISGAPGNPETLARTLKQLCGSGGTVKDGEILIQGDHRQKIAAFLQHEGHHVKLSGG